MYPQQFNVTLSPSQHAADYEVFRGILNQAGYAGSAINGPAVATSLSPYMLQFTTGVAALGDVATHATFHQYYGAGPEFTVADFYSAATLDLLQASLEAAQAAALPLTS